MIDVVTVFAPRPSHPKWRDYLPILDLQRRTVRKFGHRHVIVSDHDLDGFTTHRVELPDSLMKAQIVGQIEWLRQRNPADRCVLVDADVLVARRLETAFTGFDFAVTSRPQHPCPVNNGAMYVEAGAPVLPFFEAALALCGDHWGADQEAIAAAAAPVPAKYGIEHRYGMRFAFLSMMRHNWVPKDALAKSYNDPFVFHFKGETAKEWMPAVARKILRS